MRTKAIVMIYYIVIWKSRLEISGYLMDLMVEYVGVSQVEGQLWWVTQYSP